MSLGACLEHARIVVFLPGSGLVFVSFATFVVETKCSIGSRPRENEKEDEKEKDSLPGAFPPTEQG